MFRCYSPHYLTQTNEMPNWADNFEKPLPRISIVGEHKDGKLKIAAARCSLKDRFVRKVGRDIAEKRLREGKYLIEVNIPTCSSDLFHDFAQTIMGLIWENKIKL